MRTIRRVVLLPDYTAHNPYQWELATAMMRRGVQVELCDGYGRWPLFAARRSIPDVDVVHLHWPEHYLPSAGAARLLAAAGRLLLQVVSLRAAGTRVTWTVHNLQRHDAKHPALERLVFSALARSVSSMIVHCSSATGAVASTYRLGRRASRRMHVVPHGTFAGVYGDAVPRVEARARLALGDDECVFLHLGQVRPYRGVRELVRAFRAVPVPHVRLLVAGRSPDPHLTSELRAAARADPRIDVRPEFIPPEDVATYLGAADVVVAPYRSVLTSGNVVLAMSYGRPVIAPRLGCLGEDLAAGGGLLFDAGDARGLEAALVEAATGDLPLRRSDGGGATPFWPWSRVAELTLSAYGGTAAAGPALDVVPDSPWTMRLDRARRELGSVLPGDAEVALCDDAALGGSLVGSRRWSHFAADDGAYAGAPADGREALEHLRRCQREGVRHLVVAWPALWWLETYPELREALARGARTLLRTDLLVVYELLRDEERRSGWLS